MTTWNSVTIKNPGALTVETLEQECAFNGEGSMWEDHGLGALDDGTIYAEGRSKWQATDLIEAIEALSAEHPDATFTHNEEWDDDGVGSRETVYRGGSGIVAESRVSDMVPANLHELIAAARTEHPEPPPALAALLDALDPNGASK